jgi:phage shock protein C
MTGSRLPLYKDPLNGVLFGVCAGFAKYFNINVSLIRLFFLMSFLLTWIIYVTLALVLKNKPVDYTFTPSTANLTLDALEKKIQRIDQSIILMEIYVTSDAFEWQRKLWK